jgi:hypothetical protein
MLDIIRAWVDKKGREGIYFWFANDQTTGKPSITLFMSYVSFMLACVSLVALHFRESLLTATSMSFVFSGMMIIFYMIRSLNKASINLKDKSINLENTDKDTKDV